MIAYREWSSFDTSRDFGKWIRGIAANIVRNEICKHARRQRILHTELVKMLLGRDVEPDERTEPFAIETVYSSRVNYRKTG